MAIFQLNSKFIHLVVLNHHQIHKMNIIKITPIPKEEMLAAWLRY